MQDTPQHIKDLQLKIWLSKPPMERLRQFLIDNDAFFRLVTHARHSMDNKSRPGNNIKS
jgi:hypothetical protein